MVLAVVNTTWIRWGSILRISLVSTRGDDCNGAKLAAKKATI